MANVSAILAGNQIPSKDRGFRWTHVCTAGLFTFWSTGAILVRCPFQCTDDSKTSTQIGLPQPEWKSAQRRCKQCALTVVRPSQKIFTPLQTPFPGARDSQNLISWRWSLPLSTNLVWWGLMHANSSYGGNRPSHIQDRLQCTVPQLACSVTTSRLIVTIYKGMKLFLWYHSSPCNFRTL